MEISVEKIKGMVNSNDNNSTVANKKKSSNLSIYLRLIRRNMRLRSKNKTDASNITDDSSAMVKLTTIWNSTHIRFKLKYNI